MKNRKVDVQNQHETNLRSFLQPTRSTGVCGQKRLISGYHIAWQLRSDTGLVIEKHSNTTSDLKFHKFKIKYSHLFLAILFFFSKTCMILRNNFLSVRK